MASESKESVLSACLDDDIVKILEFYSWINCVFLCMSQGILCAMWFHTEFLKKPKNMKRSHRNLLVDVSTNNVTSLI